MPFAPSPIDADVLSSAETGASAASPDREALSPGAGDGGGGLDLAANAVLQRSGEMPAAGAAQIRERVFDAQRLENLGLLAAGIAHDLNNVLAPIVMTPGLLRERVIDPLDRQMLDVLEQSAARATDLVRQILGFARGAAGEHHVLQLKHLLRDLVGLMGETFPKSVTIEHLWEGDLWPVNGNPTQLHQTFLNLCINARDAMPAGGMLRLRAQNVVLDELAAATLEGGRTGPWVAVRIEDSGTGMPREVVARIWEPFFTTKEAGKGSGLGLPMVRSLVEAHGGFVTLDTQLGRGTTFSVYLPAADRHIEDQAPPAVKPPRGSGQLVLVVDDEKNVGNVTAATLERHGYTVQVIDDAIAAMAWFAGHHADVGLVVTDLKMPVCDGTTMATVLRRMRPDVKIVLMTGQVDDHRLGEPGRLPADGVLLKPFNSVELLQAAHRFCAAPR